MGNLCNFKDSRTVHMVGDYILNAVNSLDNPPAPGSLTSRKVHMEMDKESNRISYYLDPGLGLGTLIRFSLAAYTWPILFSYDTQISPTIRNRGIGGVLQEAKEAIARDTGYTTLMCTVNPDNAAQLKLMDEYGWRKIAEIDSEYIRMYKKKCPSNLRKAGIFIKEVSKEPMEETIPAPAKTRKKKSDE